MTSRNSPPDNVESGRSHESQSSQIQETPMEPLPSKPPRLSPQLHYSLTPKPPRKLLLLSRIVSPLPTPPSTLTSTAKRSYVAVPSEWFGSRLGSTTTYLSRNPFLRKMFLRRLFYRRLKPIEVLDGDQKDVQEPVIEHLGRPLDYWLCFPLKPPDRPECAEPLPIEDEPLSPDQQIVHTWLIWSEFFLRDQPVIRGPQPVDALAFPWVTNRSSTKMFSLRGMATLGINKINGFLECTKCGAIMGVSYILSRRFESVLRHLKDKAKKLRVSGEEILGDSDFSCLCAANFGDSPVRPFISKDLRKINWLFMLLGLNIGRCEKEQLKYFCRQRKLETSGSKNALLLRVCYDLCEQLQPGSALDLLFAEGL